jgi:hypothetical protein
MARIKGVSPAQAGPYVKFAYQLARRSVGKLPGRQTERMFAPLEIYARSASPARRSADAVAVRAAVNRP